MIRVLQTAMAGALNLSPSYSSFKNPSLVSISNPKLFNGLFFKTRLYFSTRISNASIRCFTSNAVDKVRVQNPIVEMDGTFSKLKN